MEEPSRMNIANTFSRISLKLVACVMLLAPMWAQAQAAPVVSDADKQAIRSYTLNDDVFNRLVATGKEAKAQKIAATQPDMSKVHNLDDLAEQTVGANKPLAAVVKKHGFTPREFLLANLAMMNAGMVVAAKSNPEMAKHIDQSKVNSANVSFYESHQAQIQSLMSDGQQ